MWDIVRLKEGRWEKIASHDSLEAAQNAVSASEEIFFFYAGELPAEEAAQNAIIEKCVIANEGRVRRVMIGVQIAIKRIADRPEACQGNCYCVVENGTRDCQTYYCNANGVCVWVTCGVAC